MFVAEKKIISKLTTTKSLIVTIHKKCELVVSQMT